ncbi:copper amine oxidase N-terminal domain-containing protein [Paenibacillus sp. TAB 01]|uniref:copper amine oxidase N-terminal domain-containing protein n=1 Tax=Paenibacillus sp. TAB 01 TaxID=3368988 RepID=UPI0037523CF7
MKNNRNYKWLSVFLVVLLVILAGCQSVNGLDLNKMIQNGASVKSLQGSQTFALEFIANPSVKLDEENQRLLDLFANVKLNLDEVKQQDLTHASVKGSFEYAKGRIPFQMTISDQDYTFQIEGAKKPVVIHNGPANMEELKQTLSKEMQEQLKQLYAKSAELTPSLVSYLSGNAPNPANISVSDSQTYIHNEGLSLKKVHVEIKGSELLDLFKAFATNLVADEKGMKDILGQIYDVVAPFMKQAIKENAQGQADPMNQMIEPYLNNKTLAVEFAFTFLNSNLKKMLADYDTYTAQIKDNEAARQLLSDQQTLKLDIYADRDLMPRKTNMELNLQFTGEDTSIQGLKITSTSETWNLNQPVQADVIDTSSGVVELNGLSKPSRLLAGLDPNSQLYSLLKNDLRITKKDIQMIVDNDDTYGASTKPYNANGTIMVPARFVVEQLDADVDWDPATQQVTITDWVSGAVIKLNIGSKQASVNGMIKPLETEAELTNGSTFVPVRFIAESMGATVKWDQELQMVTISRD